MLEVLEADGLATVQDEGRLGWRRYGVPAAGPMDAFAFRAANLLAGNEEDAAALEVGAGDLVLRATYDCVVAVTGAGYQLSVGPWDFTLWGSYFVRGGWTIRLNKLGFGMWAYVAVAGGLDAPRVLGSRSTYMRGRFGGMEGRLLQAGDELKIERPTRGLMEAAGRALNEEGAARVSVVPHCRCGDGAAERSVRRGEREQVPIGDVLGERGVGPDGIPVAGAAAGTEEPSGAYV